MLYCFKSYGICRIPHQPCSAVGTSPPISVTSCSSSPGHFLPLLPHTTDPLSFVPPPISVRADPPNQSKQGQARHFAATRMRAKKRGRRSTRYAALHPPPLTAHAHPLFPTANWRSGVGYRNGRRKGPRFFPSQSERRSLMK